MFHGLKIFGPITYFIMAPWVVNQLIIDINFVTDDLNFISFRPNDPFDKILRPIFWVNEYDNIPSLRFFKFKKFSIGQWNFYSINKLIHEDMVTHLYSWLHRTG